MTSQMERKIRLTLIVENNTPEGLIAEHGFAAWIEIGNQYFIFDTGQGLALEHNARCLGLDLGQAGALILSHGHYDHTGGIPCFLAANDHAPVFSGHGATIHRFSCHPDQPPRSNGMASAVLSAVKELPPQRRIELDAPRYLAPGIGITGPVPRQTLFEDTGGPFFLDAEKNVPDPISDDLSLWFETHRGLVILTGCCHSGIVNTINYIREISGIERVSGIIGGLHLLQASEHRLEQTRRFITDCELDFLIPCHCTGTDATNHLIEAFGAERVHPGQAGQTYELGTLN